MRLRNWQINCILQAKAKFSTVGKHFLCVATPGAGKTMMASVLAEHLLRDGKIDLILCFSPSIVVSADFGYAIERQTNARMDGLLGAIGRSLTYQSMIHLDESFWRLFDTHRIFVIFDEIHHCCGDSLENSNSWGHTIIEKIQGRATYTLALSGTPWRSDQFPISMARYSLQGKIHCDYSYGLTDAIQDRVCRSPQITLIDNDKIIVSQEKRTAMYASFEELLKVAGFSYQQLVENKDLIAFFLDRASRKLDVIRKKIPNAGGLIVAASVCHANEIAKILHERFDEKASIATYRVDDPVSVINNFRHSTEKWIVAVGMISEGTNIPRLRVCCHLTSIKTELHFRQILGRILRSENETDGEAYLYMPADPQLVEYASRIAKEIPDGVSLKFEMMGNLKSIHKEATSSRFTESDFRTLNFDLGFSSRNDSVSENQIKIDQVPSSLANVYASRVNVLGKFRCELVSLIRELRQ